MYSRSMRHIFTRRQVQIWLATAAILIIFWRLFIFTDGFQGVWQIDRSGILQDSNLTKPEESPETPQTPEVPVYTIEQRFRRAKEEHQRVLDHQSSNFDQAAKEYKRRYNIDPPKGFDKWFEYATEQKSMIIDDFDDVVAQTLPYRNFFKGSCDLVEMDGAFLDKHHMMQACIRDGKVTYNGQGESWLKGAMTSMLADFAGALPDLCFLINNLDEPRVLLPSDKLIPALEDTPAASFCESQSFLDLSHQEIWSEAILSCPAHSPAKLFPGRENNSATKKYVESWKSGTDLCLQTAPIHHGMLQSPTSLYVTHSVRPILSTAALSTFNDILFPSLWRFQRTGDYHAAADMSWEEKSNVAYWRGSTTGGYAQEDGWREFHRQRFVSFINDKQNNLNEKVDVRFTAVIQCDEHACDEEKRQFNLDDRQSASAGYNNKILFDLDGNGLSGRLYTLLRSNSAVMRQSIYREWHDSRLLPWLHYIPLSMELQELPELLEYFLGDGDKILADIAKFGQEWADASLRKEDMKIYLYRVLLEMSRR